MNLLLHIGTHKTATTSIQHFCALNASLLCHEGFYYPKNNMSAYEHNMLADKLARGDIKTIKAFLEQANSDAKKKGCHTIAISAESFYAMTAFFLTPRIAKGSGNLMPFDRHDDYWAKENSLIRDLKNATEKFDTVEIVCYVRPQDEFAFSIYNQLVKNVFGVNSAFETIVERIKEAFDYNQHLHLWAENFGKNNVRVYAFHTWKKNILKHFCKQHLTLKCFENAKNDAFMANTRLTRDVLEARRVYLQNDYDISTALVTARAFIGLCDKYPDQNEGDQVFGSSEFREKFFLQFQNCNDTLVRDYQLDQLLAFTQRDSTYTRLDHSRINQILSEVKSEISRPSRMAIIILKKIYKFLVTKFPFTKEFMTPIKSFLYSCKLKKLGW